jgi:penicillin-binding protein 2
MRSADPIGAELMRLRLTGLLFLATLLFLGGWLWRVQVLHATRYEERLDRQSMRRVRLPGARGRIFDRNGVCLADNRPNYCIAVYVEELRRPGPLSNTVTRVEKVIHDIASITGLQPQVSAGDIQMHIRRRRPLPLLVWRDVSEQALARLNEASLSLPGVDVYVEPQRTYPLPGVGAHVLGYVGRMDPDTNEPYHFYLPEMEGRSGVEESLNNRLAGVAGGSLIRVDVSGFKFDEEEVLEPIPGEDVTLTLDSRIQQWAEHVMRGKLGAAVMLDPRNGDILAMVSSPGFDPAAMRTPDEFARMATDETRPLFNRAIAGLYPPGSTFKPLVAFAALESQKATAMTSYNCPGYFEIGNVHFDCWFKEGHGMVAMRKAIEQSCNAYFCQLGLLCGYDSIFHMAEACGLGHECGIELNGEKPGLLPDDAWKRRVMREGWRPGDTCNVSIGQGALLVTPLQMADVVATIANGGTLYRPRLVSRDSVARPAPGEVANKMNWSRESLRIVRGGMFDVIQAETGTGKRARVSGVEMGGKTGSAEYGPRGARKKYTWVLCFAPFDAPRYAMAMVVEDGVSGGVTTAPLVHKVMAGVFAMERGEPLPAEEDNPS